MGFGAIVICIQYRVAAKGFDYRIGHIGTNWDLQYRVAAKGFDYKIGNIGAIVIYSTV